MALKYTIVFTCGTADTPPLDVKVVDVTPTAKSAQGVLDRLTEAGVTVADLKAEVLVCFGDDDVLRNLVVYTALVGLSGRRPDVAVGGRILAASGLDTKVRRSKDAGVPPVRPLHVQVGETGRGDLPEIAMSALPDPRALSMARHAKRLRMVPVADALGALNQLVAVAAVRARGTEERFPFLVQGNEPAPTEATAAAVVGLDLEQVRRDAVSLRRDTRSDDRSAVVERLAPSERQQRLLDAAAVPVEDAMARLGARFNVEADAWHCPRPDRHSNGDATPSMRVVKGRVRCGRCDDERVDALRLVMDVTGTTPDEAADWLLAVGAA